MLKRGFFVVLFLALFSSMAQASQWVVERATRDVQVSRDGTGWRDVKTGDAIPNAHWIRTGARGRVILALGTQRIMYRENTLAAVSTAKGGSKKTQVTHRRGSVLLVADKRKRQHMSVVTPHLAAVVKGTVFEVTVGRQGSSVRVDQGQVQVSDDSGSRDVPPGQTASVGANAPGISVAPATTTSMTPNGNISMGLTAISPSGTVGSRSSSAAQSTNSRSSNSGNSDRGREGFEGDGGIGGPDDAGSIGRDAANAIGANAAEASAAAQSAARGNSGADTVGNGVGQALSDAAQTGGSSVAGVVNNIVSGITSNADGNGHGHVHSLNGKSDENNNN